MVPHACANLIVRCASGQHGKYFYFFTCYECGVFYVPLILSNIFLSYIAKGVGFNLSDYYDDFKISFSAQDLLEE